MQRGSWIFIVLVLCSSNGWATLEKQILKTADDPDPRVRFQAAFTLGELHSFDKVAALARIALRDADDPWVRTAILSSVLSDAVDLYGALLDAIQSPPEPGTGVPEGIAILMRNLARTVGARNVPSEIGRFLKISADSDQDETGHYVVSGLEGLLTGFSLGEVRGVESEEIEKALSRLLASRSDAVRKKAQRVARVILPPGSKVTANVVEEAVHRLQARIEEDRAEVVSTSTEEEEWEWEYVEEGYDEEENSVEEEWEEVEGEEVEVVVDATAQEIARETSAAIRTLALGDLQETADLLRHFLEPRYPVSVQTAVLDTLASYTDPEVAEILIDSWKGLDPLMREKAIEILFGRRERLHILLEAIESGRLEPWALPREKQVQLFNFPDEEIVARARELFDEDQDDEDPALYEKYRAALDLEGNVERGHAIYKKRCVQCHKVGDEGVEVGPDWSSVQSNTKEQLLVSILYPNRFIAPGFTDYVVETTSGKVVTGLIKSSEDASITLRRAGGEESTVLRRTIKRIENTKLSLMPVGLQEGLTPQDMADLLAFIQSLH